MLSLLPKKLSDSGDLLCNACLDGKMTYRPIRGRVLERLQSILAIKGQASLIQTRIDCGILKRFEVEEPAVGCPIVRILVRAPVNACFVEELRVGGPFQGQTVQVGSGAALGVFLGT
jgi:hypothetical protein